MKERNVSEERLLIVDCGSQLTQLIARRVRECGVYCDIFPYHKIDMHFLNEYRPAAVIISGGPASVNDDEAPRLADALFTGHFPVLGICYGQQAMVKNLGGEVEAGKFREFGRSYVDVIEQCELFDNVWSVGGKEQVWMSHGDRVVSLPEGFRVVGSSTGAPFAAIADDDRKFYGFQFHPEVVHTPHGRQLIRAFAHRVAGCSGNWTMETFRDQALARVKQQVGKERVICGLSGGVDSSVVAALIHEAVQEQLTCVLIDTGFLRWQEANEVVALFRDTFNIRLVHRDASDIFLARLDGVNDPEQKRKIIGATLVEVFEEEAKKIGGATFLAQGTLYPDVIESVSFQGGPSVTIKSHHNVGGLPERMNMRLLEPLRELFKDEVRELGKTLGLPDALVGRHPFPGPGLAIRIPGPISADKLDQLRQADRIFLEEIRNANLYDAIWQAFAVLLPVRTVGVMGDARTYEHVVALRAVTSTDGMTADSYPFQHSFLSRVANRIINEVTGINRVVYDVTSKPPGTIEWE